MRWGTRQPLPLPIAFVSFVAVLAVLLAAVFALPAAAHADEPAEGDNAVNTQQLPDSSFIYDTSIVDLSGADAYYDNQTVQVTGEVIGDSIRAGVSGRHRWPERPSCGGGDRHRAGRTPSRRVRLQRVRSGHCRGGRRTGDAGRVLLAEGTAAVGALFVTRRRAFAKRPGRQA